MSVVHHLLGRLPQGLAGKQQAAGERKLLLGLFQKARAGGAVQPGLADQDIHGLFGHDGQCALCPVGELKPPLALVPQAAPQ